MRAYYVLRSPHAHTHTDRGTHIKAHTYSSVRICTCAELISEDKLKIKITNSRQNVKKTTISHIRIASVCQWKQTKRAEQSARTHTQAHIQAGSLDKGLSTSGLSATVVVCACLCVCACEWDDKAYV